MALFVSGRQAGSGVGFTSTKWPGYRWWRLTYCKWAVRTEHLVGSVEVLGCPAISADGRERDPSHYEVYTWVPAIDASSPLWKCTSTHKRLHSALRRAMAQAKVAEAQERLIGAWSV